MPGRLIFLESNTTGTGMLALRTAARLGLDPVLLTSDPGRYLGLAATGAQVLPCDTNSAAVLAETVLSQRARPAGVTTTSEFYLAAVAELTERLGLPGNPAAAIRLCRDKASMRQALADSGPAGVDQPRFVAVRDVRQLASALRAVGLPCVVKPVNESGSQDVRLCRSEPQARAHLERVLAARVNARGQPAAGVALVEQYLPAPEYSVEMFSIGGEAHCIGITAKCVAGDPYFVEAGHYYPADLEETSARSVLHAVRAALTALGIGQGPTHTEVKVTPDGVAIIEINARLAGGMIPELIRMVDGIDLIEQQIRAAVGLPVLLDPVSGADRCAGIRFVTATRAGTVLEVTGLDRAGAQAGVRAVSVRVQPGASVRPARNAYERLGHVIATGPDRQAVQRRLDRAIGSIRLTLGEPAVSPDLAAR